MEAQIESLADAIVAKHLEVQPTGRRTMVAIAGVPGAGKTTVTPLVVAAVNRRLGGRAAAAFAMDGFHMYRKELDAMPNAAEAHARRGAPWTFNEVKLEASLTAVRSGGEDVISIPSFDHAVGDPCENATAVERGTLVCIWEGIYLLGPWPSVTAQFDLRVFLDIDVEVATQRLILRHMAAWAMGREEAEERARANDYVNAQLVVMTKPNADIVINSV